MAVPFLEVASRRRPEFDVAMVRLARQRIVRAVRIAAFVGTALSWVFERVEVNGDSMAPTYLPGDRLLLVRRFRPLRAGDVVAFDDPRGSAGRIVKRVTSVSPGGVEVLGDNPGSSTDSRAFGPVPQRSVEYLVIRRYATGGPS
jgi:nickel-type superoxide dismutase maturation protease